VDEPKKRRRLLIIDVEEDGQTPVAYAPTIPRTPVVFGPGHVHGRTQQEVMRLCREARYDEEKIEARLWNRVDEILKAKSIEEAEVFAKKAMEVASVFFLLNTKKPEKQAKAAERIAEMYRRKGEDGKADKQLAKAKKIRAEMAAEAKERKP